MTLEPTVIFEDDQMLVLDKPAGWVVNEAVTTGKNPVVQTWLKKNFEYEIVHSKEERSGIVHRLDKETSGILVVAKTQTIFRNLQEQFKNRKINKFYTALVHGKVEPKDGEINLPVGRLPWNRERFGVIPGGRKSITNYIVEAYLQMPASNSQPTAIFSLLKLNPKTGRTHQIRIHLKYLGYPIVSDEFYTGRKTARRDRIWCQRLFLHASELSLYHPLVNRNVTYKSQLPNDLSRALNSLEKI